VDDFDIVAVRVEHPGRIVAGIVFEPCLRWALALASSIQGCFVERVYFSMVLRYEPDMDCFGIGFSFFEPEERSLAVAKTLQIRMSVLAVVVCEVGYAEWFQGLAVESD